MKSLLNIVWTIFAAIAIISCASQKSAEVTKKIPVRGNCGMCEATIEKAAMEVDGVKQAEWDQEQELLTVVYDSSKTDNENIEENIAATGYDTKNFAGNMDAFNNLPRCCIYEDKK